MATSYTFARLTPPPQFRPEETATFKLEYSQDLVCTYATLVVDGYTDDTYTGTSITQYVNMSLGWDWDTGYAEFVVPGGTLGATPSPEQQEVEVTGTCRARVEFRKLQSDVKPFFVSNSVVVNMLVMWDRDLIFYGTPYVADTSSFTPQLKYIVRHDLGVYASNQVNSYRYFLYDSEYNLIQDSGELYDWNNYIYWTDDGSYTFHGLKDGHTYYVRAKVTLNGGYTLWRGYEPITVQYGVLPDASDIFDITSIHNGAQLRLDLTGIAHDRVVFSRTIVRDNKYLELYDNPNPADIISAVDHYAVTGTYYLYRAVVYNGNAIVGTYYNYLHYKNSYITISDAYGSYVAVGNLEKYPISRNDRGQEFEAMDSKYPYYIVNGSPDYDRGSVNGLFTTITDCKIDTDNQEYASLLRAWLNNGRTKVLTYYTGESWIVAVSGVQTTDPDNTDTLNTSFNWVQVAETDDINAYTKLGLVMIDA